MFKDKVIITSPGGLLPGMNEEEFLNGSFSLLRNPVIANVFLRLNIVEVFATCIRKIINVYKAGTNKAVFKITDNAITVILPLIYKIELNDNEQKLISFMDENYKYSTSKLLQEVAIKRDTLIRTLNSLIEKGLVNREGKAKATVYYKK